MATVNRKNAVVLLGKWQGVKRIEKRTCTVLLEFLPRNLLQYQIRQGDSMVCSGRLHLHWNARHCVFVDALDPDRLYPAEITLMEENWIHISGFALLAATYTRQ